MKSYDALTTYFSVFDKNEVGFKNEKFSTTSCVPLNRATSCDKTESITGKKI